MRHYAEKIIPILRQNFLEVILYALVCFIVVMEFYSDVKPELTGGILFLMIFWGVYRSRQKFIGNPTEQEIEEVEKAMAENSPRHNLLTICVVFLMLFLLIFPTTNFLVIFFVLSAVVILIRFRYLAKRQARLEVSKPGRDLEERREYIVKRMDFNLLIMAVLFMLLIIINIAEFYLE